MQAFSTGLTPRGDAVDTEILPGALGRRFKLGKPCLAQVVVTIIDTVPTGCSVWSFVKDCAVPEQARLGIGAGDHATAAAALAAQRLPNVGYADVPAKKRPMFKHPNNEAHRERLLAADQEDPAQVPLSPSEELILAQLPARGKRGHNSDQRKKIARQRKVRKLRDSIVDPEEVFGSLPEFPFAEHPNLPENLSGHEQGVDRNVRNTVSQKKGVKHSQVIHDVYAEFGKGEKGTEVWLFVKSGRDGVLYLTQEGLGNKWGVTQVGSDLSFSQKKKGNFIEKVFKKVLFEVSGVGKKRTTITAKPFDSTEWESLVRLSHT